MQIIVHLCVQNFAKFDARLWLLLKSVYRECGVIFRRFIVFVLSEIRARCWMNDVIVVCSIAAGRTLISRQQFLANCFGRSVVLNPCAVSFTVPIADGFSLLKFAELVTRQLFEWRLCDVC